MTDLKNIKHPALSDAFLMPFTANKQFRQTPRLLQRAEGMYYYDIHGRKILDGTASLWCCNAGHSRPEITKAIAAQAEQLDYSLSFQVSHPDAFTLADRLAGLAPEPLNHVFFTNSGSESVDSALKLTRAYWQARGQSGKTMFIGRERGYHGVGFGGVSVGGIMPNRKHFQPLLPSVDHLDHTHLPENYFCQGMGEHGGEQCADQLERIINLHGANNIGAVIVEPVAGLGGGNHPPQRLPCPLTRDYPQARHPAYL